MEDYRGISGRIAGRGAPAAAPSASTVLLVDPYFFDGFQHLTNI
jgi:hypothetical protein